MSDTRPPGGTALEGCKTRLVVSVRMGANMDQHLELKLTRPSVVDIVISHLKGLNVSFESVESVRSSVVKANLEPDQNMEPKLVASVQVFYDIDDQNAKASLIRFSEIKSDSRITDESLTSLDSDLIRVQIQKLKSAEIRA